jgi:CRISPR-associated Csx2 family protein
MANLFLSFLGTNNYLPCTYFFEDREVKNVRFVQEALVQIFCRQWKKDDRIIVFTTYDADDKNWYDGGLKDGEGKPHEGLETRLSSLGLQCEIRKVMIPEGYTAEDIWKIFDQVCNQINDSDTIIFDITHAFRSIPMLAMVVLQYLKVLKKIQVSSIYYGAFEVLGPAWKVKDMPLKQRWAPIVDLADFVYLADWVTAVERFLAAGDSVAIADLVKKKAIPVIKTATTDTAEREGAVAVRCLADSLTNFSGIMATCRGLQITEAATNLIKNIDNCEAVDLISPLLPLLEKLKESMKGFREEDEIANGLQAARWCLEHNLIQQAYTILQETVVSLVLCHMEYLPAPVHPIETQKRELVTGAASLIAKKKPFTEARQVDGTKELWPLVWDFLSERDIGRQLDRMRNRRNDLNHAGINDQPANSSSFKKDLQEILDWFASIQQHTGGNWE